MANTYRKKAALAGFKPGTAIPACILLRSCLDANGDKFVILVIYLLPNMLARYIAVFLSFVAIHGYANGVSQQIERHSPACFEKLAHSTGAFILDKGEDALLSRAWLTQKTTHSIDIQYFPIKN
ncbi:MAG: hypothetical protein KUG79_08725 [Pseudomonadales bacterium]|nr:hypothetical protein [Pseudomonadales bacterium]